MKGIGAKDPYGKANLPDIVKRGPVNKDKSLTRKIVGLSLQKRNPEPQKFARHKRGSLESTLPTKSHRNTKARNAVLKAQHLEVPRTKPKPASRPNRVPGGAYRMPPRQ